MKKTPFAYALALLTAGTLLAIPSARALDGTWIGNAAGIQNWSTPGNWSGSNIADGIGAIGNLTFDITAARNVTIDSTSRTLGILNIGDPGAALFVYTLAASGGATLTMDNSGLQAQINLAGTNNNISVPLQLTAGGLAISNTAGLATAPIISGAISSAASSGTQILTVSSNGSGLYSFSGQISDGNSGGLVGILVDGGTIGLTGTNSFTGDLTISKGLVRTSTLALNDAGTIRLGDSNTGLTAVQFSPNGGTYGNNIVVDGSGSGLMKIESSGGTPSILGISGVFNGDISLGRTLTVNTVGGALFLNGDISGTGGLDLGVNGSASAANALIISGNNSFSGGFKTNGNTLFNIATATAPGTGTWTIGPGNTTRALDLKIDNTSTAAMTLTNNNDQIWSSFTFVGSDNMNMGTGGVSISDTQAIITVLNNRLTVGGVISGASKIVGNGGVGTLALTGANTYTGATFVGGNLAVTSLANGAVASNIGQSSNLAANLVLNRGNLQYGGTAVTTDRLFTVGNGGATIESSGSGALQFGNTNGIDSTDTVTFATPLSFTATPATIISMGGVTSENTTANLAVGQTISGVGIAPGTTITQIFDAHQIQISQATTGVAASGAYTFGALDRTLTLTGSNTGNNTIAGILVNAASRTLGVTKTGVGKWVLSGTNTYTGATNVSAGTLVISGSGNINSSAVSVAGGAKLAYNSSTASTSSITLNGSGISRATLSGTGAINSALVLNNRGDTLSPGNSPGIQPFLVGQTWNSFTYEWEANDFVANVAGTNFDQISIAGGLTLTGTTGSYGLDLFSLTGANVAGNLPNFAETNRSWTILTTTGGITGFNAGDWTIATGGFTSSPTWAGNWSISQSGNNLLLNYTTAVIPEPGTSALLFAGVGVVLLLKRRRRNG